MSYAIIDYSNRRWEYPLRICSDADKISIFLPHFKERKSKSYAKRVLKILNNSRINNIVVNNEILKNRNFCEELVDNKKYIITGRRIYKALLLRILKDVSKQMNVDLEKLKVVLLVDEYTVENVDLIRCIARNVKSLTVVTTDKDKFNRLTTELYENFGIILKVYEKNKSNYKYANILVNADFPSYEMEKINVGNNSLIICGFAKLYKIKPNFNGIIIRNVDVISRMNSNPMIDELALCEAQIYSYLRKLKENDREFEKQGFKINGYFGENGKILSEDFQKLGKIILDK